MVGWLAVHSRSQVAWPWPGDICALRSSKGAPMSISNSIGPGWRSWNTILNVPGTCTLRIWRRPARRGASGQRLKQPRPCAAPRFGIQRKRWGSKCWTAIRPIRKAPSASTVRKHRGCAWSTRPRPSVPRPMARCRRAALPSTMAIRCWSMLHSANRARPGGTSIRFR